MANKTKDRTEAALVIVSNYDLRNLLPGAASPFTNDRREFEIHLGKGKFSINTTLSTLNYVQVTLCRGSYQTDIYAQVNDKLRSHIILHRPYGVDVSIQYIQVTTPPSSQFLPL